MHAIDQKIFTRKIAMLGEISIRPIELNSDIKTLHNWVTQPYAKYWGMLNKTEKEVYLEYEEIEKQAYHNAYMGVLNGQSIFLMECYKASEDIIAEYYDAQENDYGMHVLVAPSQKRIPQFTWHIFSTIITYFFSMPKVNRIIVEPDVNNKKIHVLNKKAGFIYEKEIELPQKKAALAFCTKENYEEALKKL
ncbi:GNAT family N-acetyltransferase [Tenacibaculum maritimum]|uniref:GNAT family N-acetyltransferase n=1 Tax=Tenacibaculum maritimum TaxID=107401 RepID=UPI0012E5330B|nr:GNAT family N-acetyltransferase [Tenacibaculum maritimum]CAA0181012.1 Siderophore biosynthesis protein TbsC [Tenacibaculum maritimum]